MLDVRPSRPSGPMTSPATPLRSRNGESALEAHHERRRAQRIGHHRRSGHDRDARDLVRRPPNSRIDDVMAGCGAAFVTARRAHRPAGHANGVHERVRFEGMPNPDRPWLPFQVCDHQETDRRRRRSRSRDAGEARGTRDPPRGPWPPRPGRAPTGDGDKSCDDRRQRPRRETTRHHRPRGSRLSAPLFDSSDRSRVIPGSRRRSDQRHRPFLAPPRTRTARCAREVRSTPRVRPSVRQVVAARSRESKRLHRASTSRNHPSARSMAASRSSSAVFDWLRLIT